MWRCRGCCRLFSYQSKSLVLWQKDGGLLKPLRVSVKLFCGVCLSTVYILSSNPVEVSFTFPPFWVDKTKCPSSAWRLYSMPSPYSQISFTSMRVTFLNVCLGFHFKEQTGNPTTCDHLIFKYAKGLIWVTWWRFFNFDHRFRVKRKLFNLLRTEDFRMF